MKKNIVITLLLAIPVIAIMSKYFSSEFMYQWHSDKVSNFNFSYESEGKSFGSSLGSVYSIVENQEIQADIAGSISIDEVKNKEGNTFLKITLKPKSYKYQYIKDNRVVDIPLATLKFYVDWDMKTGFGDFYFPRDTVKEYEYMAKDILSMLQIKLKDTQTLRWKSMHESFSGGELVDYNYWPSIADFFQGGELIKSLLFSNEGRQFNGEMVVSISKDRRIVSVLGDKKEIYLIDNNIISSNSKSLVMQFSSYSDKQKSTQIVDISDRRKFKLRSFDGAYTKKRLAQRADMELISGRSYQEIIKPFESLEALEIKDQASMFQSLSAYMRMFPGSVERVAELLKDYSKSDYQFDIISTALGAVGTPEAQALMTDFISQSDGPEKTQVMLNLAFVNNPTVETEELYWEMYNSSQVIDERKKSLFSIGIMTSKMDVKSDRYVESVSNISSLYKDASTDKEKKLIIKAMANTRSTDFYDEMAAAVSDDNGLKLTALRALKDIKNENSKSLLLNASESDDDVERYTAVISLSNYDLDNDTLHLYGELLDSETNEKITTQVLKNLDSDNKTGGSIQLAREYLEKCPTTDLCKLAKRALN